MPRVGNSTSCLRLRANLPLEEIGELLSTSWSDGLRVSHEGTGRPYWLYNEGGNWIEYGTRSPGPWLNHSYRWEAHQAEIRKNSEDSS